MGTNYYAITNTCKHCGRSDQEIHLGKSSAGWQFSLQYNGGQYYKSVPEMKRWLKGKKIKNEYGEKVSHKKFWEMVEAKKKTKEPTDQGDLSSLNIIIVDGYKFYDTDFS